jgi:hypothetical protein
LYVYHLDPVDESDDSLSDSSYDDNYKHDNFSSEFLCPSLTVKIPLEPMLAPVDLMLAPVVLMMPIHALSFFQMTKQHSALPHSFPSKGKANLVKLELVNLILEISVPLHLFHKIAQNRLPKPILMVTYSSLMTAHITKLT